MGVIGLCRHHQEMHRVSIHPIMYCGLHETLMNDFSQNITMTEICQHKSQRIVHDDGSVTRSPSILASRTSLSALISHSLHLQVTCPDIVTVAWLPCLSLSRYVPTKVPPLALLSATTLSPGTHVAPSRHPSLSSLFSPPSLPSFESMNLSMEPIPAASPSTLHTWVCAPTRIHMDTRHFDS